MKDKENTEPLLTNTDLGSAMDVYEKSLEEHTSHDVITRLNMTTAYGAGARTLRDLYEAARSKDKERIAALEAALGEAPGVASHDANGVPIMYEGVCTDPACSCKMSRWVFAARALLNPQPPTT